MLFPRQSPNSERQGKSRGGKNASPLDLKHQALRETEAKLRKHQEELERLIHEAPRRREEQTRRRREELAGDTRLSRTTLVDKHAYHVSTMANPAFGRRPLRSEKRDGLYLFLFLIAVLASIVFWICRLIL
jgi:hypothetical protein